MRFPDRKNILVAFSVVFLVKFLTVAYLGQLTFCQDPAIKGSALASIAGDSFSYIGAMENYVTKGVYFFVNSKGEQVFAGRLPHYSIPYYLFRQILSPEGALNLFVILQLAVETVAIILLGLLAYEITERKWAYYGSLLLSSVSLYITIYSFGTITDGMAANFMVIAAYYYYHYVTRGRSKRDLLLFSVFLAIATCLRPYLCLVYVFAGIAEVWRNRWVIAPTVKSGLILALPLVLLLAPWVVRNYNLLHRVILFQQDPYAGYHYDEDELAIRKVLTVLGEDGNSFWDKSTAASYFHPRHAKNSKYSYPSYISTDEATFQNIENLRILNLSGSRAASAVVGMADSFLNFYKAQFPLRFYVWNPVIRVKKFLLNSGSYYLPVNKSFSCYRSWQVFLKLSQSLLYYVYLFLGFLGLVFMVRQKRANFIFLLPTLFLIVFFPLLLGAIEWRFFVPFYLFHQLGLLFIIAALVHKFRPSAKTA
ncbi:hypothetical protein V9K67_20170 [Paraflavisolibacter sp. H34]|uniref:hypothetical protein n=1 Tax=Huijunlia imazamoxiresistens TaxID=3127457 RepID=UPI00301686E3